MDKNLSDLRREYKKHKLDKSSLHIDPKKQFEFWLEDAIKSKVNEPTAMILATCGNEGSPSARVVLLKDINEKGITFYTNYRSRKGTEISENPAVAALFYWSELERQVRIEGTAQKLKSEESTEYFNSRPFESRISAAISPQSHEIPNRDYLEKSVSKLKQSITNDYVPKPPDWGGYLIIPERYEFWQGRENRLHDRLVYRKVDKKWEIVRLAP